MLSLFDRRILPFTMELCLELEIREAQGHLNFRPSLTRSLTAERSQGHAWSQSPPRDLEETHSTGLTPHLIGGESRRSDLQHVPSMMLCSPSPKALLTHAYTAAGHAKAKSMRP